MLLGSSTSTSTNTRSKNDTVDSTKRLLTLLRRQEKVETTTSSDTTMVMSSSASSVSSASSMVSVSSTVSSNVTPTTAAQSTTTTKNMQNDTTHSTLKSNPTVGKKGEMLIKILKRDTIPSNSGTSIASTTQSIGDVKLTEVPPLSHPIQSNPEMVMTASLNTNNNQNTSDTINTEKAETKTSLMEANKESTPMVQMRRVNPSILFAQKSTTIPVTTEKSSLTENIENNTNLIPASSMSAAAMEFMRRPAAVAVLTHETKVMIIQDSDQQNTGPISSDLADSKVVKKLVPSIVIRKKPVKK